MAEIKLMSQSAAAGLGYSKDRRKRRREHRRAAKMLQRFSGETARAMGYWHIAQARLLK